MERRLDDDSTEVPDTNCGQASVFIDKPFQHGVIENQTVVEAIA